MSKSIFLSIIGAVIVAIAIGLSFILDSDDEALGPLPGTATIKAAPGAPPAPGADKADAVQPSFDVVRINPEGDTVMAGRAAPGATVRIYDGDKLIGEVQADRRGVWVFVPKSPLAPGSHKLSLKAIGADGTEIASAAEVVLVVPEPGKDIAGRGQVKTGLPLAMRVPKNESDAVEILQKPGAAGGSFTIDAVDYDDGGRLDIVGHATAGDPIHLYLDNGFIGRTTADRRGRWRHRPKDPVAAGVYTLRADRVGPGGKVLARVEVHFARSAPLTGIQPGSLIVVRPGNSLWRIARQTYGTGFKYTVIYEANKKQIKSADLIYPGQVFQMPPVN